VAWAGVGVAVALAFGRMASFGVVLQPAVRQQLVKAVGGQAGQAGEHVAQVQE
jgi:hypothetical protein